MSESTWSAVTWDIARAGGLTAYALLALSVALGLALSLRWQRPQWPRLITNELHDFLTGLALIFMVVHGAALWLDPYMRFTWQELFVPLTSHYRPLWTALGIVALYLAVAVRVSTRLRPYIGYGLWRRLHTLAFGVYLFSTLHGLAAGSDTREPWALGLYAGSALLIATLLELRLLTPIGARGTTHPRLAALTAAVVFIGAAWTVVGPLHGAVTLG
ncbi:MAG: iron reductase [Chloroflexi bacterium]|nr:iron reductase [Chloroflexota bacterium]